MKGRGVLEGEMGKPNKFNDAKDANDGDPFPRIAKDTKDETRTTVYFCEGYEGRERNYTRTRARSGTGEGYSIVRILRGLTPARRARAELAHAFHARASLSPPRPPANALPITRSPAAGAPEQLRSLTL
jgi:hypothetical protein